MHTTGRYSINTTLGGNMFTPTTAFSGFSVNSIQDAKAFYSQILDLEVKEEGPGLTLTLPGGASVIAYEKADHQPATFTILNFVVEDINTAVAELKARGLTFERYDGMHQDDNDIARGIAHNMGPDIAWCKDPAGNILAVMQE